MDNSNIYDLIILGGGCAGLSAGIYGARAKLKTLIIEKQQPGGQAAITADIANYPGFLSVSGAELTAAMQKQAKLFGAELASAQITDIDFSDTVKKVYTSKETLLARAVIIATGALPRKAGFEGEAEFAGRGVSYCATCDGFFYRGKQIFVIGGGNSAAEEALFLTRFAEKVTVLVRRDRLRCTAAAAEELLAHPKTEVLFNCEMVRVSGGARLTDAVYKNNLTGEEFFFSVPPEQKYFGVFVFAGYEPASGLFAGKVQTDEQGCILTNEDMETSVPGVFAAGDVRRKSLRQVVTAASDGAIAAVQAEKYIAAQKHSGR